MPDSYSGYDIKQLFQMVDAARQGLEPSRKQHAALKRATEMLGEHAGALQGYRDQLAAKWPPESNAASAAYLAELDKLLTAVKDTAQTSAVNAFHVNLVTEAIVQAHDTLKPLHDEYVNNEGLLRQYDAKVAAAGDDYEMVGGAPAGAAARGLTRLFTSSPVDDGRQEELVRQARQAMVPLSVAAQDGGTYITPPPPYAPPTVDGAQHLESTQFGGGSGGGAIRPPVIDPPSHARGPASPDEGRSAPRSEFAFGPTPSDSPAAPPRHTGPVLSGVLAPASPQVPPAPPALPAAGPLGGGVPAPTGVSLPMGSPTMPSTGGNPHQLPKLPVDHNGNVRGSAGTGGTGARPVPLSGLIGNSPLGVIGGTPAGGSGQAVRSTQRVSPVGGLIGLPPGEISRPASAVGAGGAGLMAPPYGRHGHGKGGADAPRWDPDNPWAVAEGVAPVIRPDTRVDRFDPGPGVIGLDR